MKRIIVLTIVVLAIFSVCFAGAATFNVNKSDYNSTAIVSSDSNSDVSFAPQELQKHLQLITGFKFPIVNQRGSYNKVFYVGLVPATDKKQLQPEEARYLITDNAVYLYGGDNVNGNIHNGTLFAVYNFLENELGVRWIEPGDGGIYYVPSDKITLKEKSSSWLSPFEYQRGYRMSGFRSSRDKFVSKEFQLTADQSREKRQDSMIWLKRMRMGSRNNPMPFGHAFNDWWAKYGKTHPEYFALNGNGVRAPLGEWGRIKMCPSNLGLAKQIVDDWWAKKQAGQAGDVFSICENDSEGFGLAEWCHCDNCKALDFLKPGEKFGANLTDRYVYMWNNVLRLAREKDPKASPSVYVYASQLNPPRKLRVDKGLKFGYVPYFNDDFKYRESIYKGWQKMGVDNVFYRPNDLGCDLGLPLGQEKRVFENLKLAVKYGANGTDHDSCFNFWTGISGINYYIVAKAQIDPSKSFEYWENEYTSMYGDAKEDVKKYFRYWRNEVFEKRLMPADVASRTKGFDAGIMAWGSVAEYGRNIDKYYFEKDFDITNKFLQDASNKNLNAVQRKLLDRLIAANKHNQLTYEAMLANETGTLNSSVQAAKNLLDFRINNKDILYIDWANLFDEQRGYGDICGMNKAAMAGRKQEFSSIKIDTSPKIDGILDEPFWKDADTNIGFLKLQDAGEPKAQTKTYFAHNDKSFYIAITCYEPKINQVKENITKRDGEVWADNAVEIFLDPSEKAESYAQLVISSAGVMFDCNALDDKWNLEIGKDINYAVSKGADYWQLEIEIPFQSKLMQFNSESTKFNIGRDRTLSDSADNEKSSLAALFGGFLQPKRFVTMLFK